MTTTTTVQNDALAPAIKVGYATFGSVIERQESTVAGLREGGVAALMVNQSMPTPGLTSPSTVLTNTWATVLMVDQAMPTLGQFELFRRLNEEEARPESERWPAADPPCKQAFADARSFICRLPLCPIRLPDIGVADDGEVNFLWDGDGVYIDLGFYGTGDYSYFALDEDGQKFHGDDVPATGILPAELVNLIRSERN